MSTAIAEEKKTSTKLNQLEQLKKFTKVVADTADPYTLDPCSVSWRPE